MICSVVYITKTRCIRARGCIIKNSYELVINTLKELKDSGNHQTMAGSPSNISSEVLVNLINQGLDDNEIASKLGMIVGAVHTAYRKYNVDRNQIFKDNRKKINKLRHWEKHLPDHDNEFFDIYGTDIDSLLDNLFKDK